MQVEGDILFSGHKPDTAFLRHYTGYVEQFGERRNPSNRFHCYYFQY